jgi:PAS domain S-box-containing protein
MSSLTTEFENLLSAIPDAVVGVDPAGLIRFANRQMERLFGYDPDELVGRAVETLLPESHRQAHIEQRQEYDASPRTRPMGADLKLSGLRRDGTVFPADISLSPMDTPAGRLVIAVVRDMTRYWKAEADRRRLDRMAAVVEFSGEAIVSVGLDGDIRSWNPAAVRMYGYSHEEIIGRSVMLLTPKSRVEESKALLAGTRAGQSVEDLETLSIRKDGSEFAISLTISPIHDPDGAITGASTTIRDLTRQKQAFEATQRMAAVVEHSGEAIISHTPEGIVTSWNPAAERTFGYSAEEIIGRSIELLTPPARQREHPAFLSRLKAGHGVDHLETIRVRKDGTRFPVSITASPILDAEGAVVGGAAVMRDLTEQRRTFESARSMIEASLDSLVAISPDGKITDANEATVKLTGVPRDKLIGTSFSEYFTDPGKAEEIYQRVFTEGAVSDYPLTLRHRDGHQTLTEVLYNASAYSDIEGNVLGVFATARDVTRRVQAQKEAAEQQAREMDRLAELERFQRLTVGRELKMIELKKEIEYLRRSARPERGEPGDQD